MEGITDVALANILAEVHGSKAKRELTDKLDDLPGVLMTRISANKIVFYYKFRWEKKRQLLYLGIYSQRVKKDRITLPQAFDEATKHALIRKEGKNPKEVIQQKKDEQEAGLRRRIKQAEIQGFGTFARLLSLYEDSLKGKTKVHVVSAFKRVKNTLPELLTMQARDIEWDHLKPVFDELLNEGKGPMANNTLAYLKAAFNKVMKITLDSGMTSTVENEFGVLGNPLQNVKKNPEFQNTGKTEWQKEEIAVIWHNAIKYKGPITGRLIRFIIATAGQRISQTLRVSWKEYLLDLDHPFFVISNMKKKRGGKETPHIVPLNKLALAEIKAVQEITGHCDYPFAGRIGAGRKLDQPLTEARMYAAMGELCSQIGLRHLTLGATRTTIKTLLGPTGIDKHIKNMLHGHGLMDVADKNYDKYDYFDEKIKAMDIWNDLLEKILEENKPLGMR